NRFCILLFGILDDRMHDRWQFHRFVLGYEQFFQPVIFTVDAFQLKPADDHFAVLDDITRWFIERFYIVEPSGFADERMQFAFRYSGRFFQFHFFHPNESFTKYVCRKIVIYERLNKSNRKKRISTSSDSTSFSSSSISSSVSSASTMTSAFWSTSSEASATFVSPNKSTKHKGGKSTHHQFSPVPSPSVIKTASYSPSG